MWERKRTAVSSHCECMRRRSKEEAAGLREVNQCQERFWSMAGDLSAWRNLELDVEVSCEAAGRGLLVENLPLSSQLRYIIVL